jgi:hypothetical protein
MLEHTLTRFFLFNCLLVRINQAYSFKEAIVFIDTTINIKGALAQKINTCSIRYSIPRSRVICMLVDLLLENSTLSCVLYNRVKYQKRNPTACWENLHVYLSPLSPQGTQDIQVVCGCMEKYSFISLE